MGRRKLLLAADLKDRVVAARKAGATWAGLMRRFSLSHKVLRRTLEEAGLVEHRGPCPRATEEERSLVLSLHATGLSSHLIAARIVRSRRVVTRFLAEAGLPHNGPCAEGAAIKREQGKASGPKGAAARAKAQKLRNCVLGWPALPQAQARVMAILWGHGRPMTRREIMAELDWAGVDGLCRPLAALLVAGLVARDGGGRCGDPHLYRCVDALPERDAMGRPKGWWAAALAVLAPGEEPPARPWTMHANKGRMGSKKEDGHVAEG